ncbi:hypothetical protein AOC05_18105 [Arthrobacter alpinus]|uniref:Methyltransferase domain-containing protein n=1 Tax=Arthrobacter alpinus TaxID=656366 RepID=A0A0M5LY25_9MICC|nr:bifunctional PIG-L family deacetylase/class I SAM-dependent methyltransferase [Arthrobacter alpinus]ALE93794.1 hypothetical protein AOC05_18105 [Arthrobacter alpinus]
MVTFTHDQEATPEADWLESPRVSAMAELGIDWDTVEKLIVVAAHPDDETLGAAGLLQRAADHGVSVEVLVATMGEKSHPRSTTHTPEHLAALRTIELQKALAVLTPGVNCRTLRLPDGGLSEHTRDLEHEIATAATPGGAATLIVAPWSADGHTDHDAAGAAATNAAALTGSLLLEYPIWMWHWGSPAHPNVPWPALRKFGLTPKEHALKAAAMSSHTSQIAPLSDNAGDETLLSPALLAHFGRSFETFIDMAGKFTPSGPRYPAWLGTQFDAVHADGAEPWDPQSWYETRKRSLLLAALPRTLYQSTLELGCSTGALTAELAPRSRQITGVDASAEAAASAKLRLATIEHAHILHSTLPQEWPPGRFDLFVLSETGYYFTAEELSEVVGKMAASALPDTCVAACHWRHPIAGWPLGGDDVHRILRNDARLKLLAAYTEEDFLLEMFCFRDAP